MLRPCLILLVLSLLSLAACQQEQTAAFLDTDWQWVSTLTPVERIESQSPERYTLRLQPDGNAALLFDCNRGRGTYEIADNQISFSPLIATRMACPDDTQDFVFMSQLERVTSFFIQDGNLFLEMPADSGTMRFQPAQDSNQEK